MPPLSLTCNTDTYHDLFVEKTEKCGHCLYLVVYSNKHFELPCYIHLDNNNQLCKSINELSIDDLKEAILLTYETLFH